ncbi:hypothetical protein SAY86_006234 [Trapa natans]|uniref:Uncharacterized protein n=1 Tax=Trapa natans TaxID=22666 RepID=A0AAN7L481_TRANT|nr:hypothetical protein SAY86_006234 [Trapa natans]
MRSSSLVMVEAYSSSLWNVAEEWSWVEHGMPDKGVALVSSPGPCFSSGQLFLIGSDGVAYLRYMDQAMWKWEDLGYSLSHYVAFGYGMATS